MENSIASMTPQTWTVETPEDAEYTIHINSDPTAGNFNLNFTKKE